MIKRNSKRYTYTVARRNYESDVLNEDTFQYFRGEGIINPRPSVNSVQTASGAFSLSGEIDVFTRDPYPVLDGDNVDIYGRNYTPDVVMWSGVPFVAYGANLWEAEGKNSYRRMTCLFTSEETWDESSVRSLNWDEIKDFKLAIDCTELVIEFKLNKVLN